MCFICGDKNGHTEVPPRIGEGLEIIDGLWFLKSVAASDLKSVTASDKVRVASAPVTLFRSAVVALRRCALPVFSRPARTRPRGRREAALELLQSKLCFAGAAAAAAASGGVASLR